MKKQYIKPIMDVELIEYQQTILAGSGNSGDGYGTGGTGAGGGGGTSGPPTGPGGAGAPELFGDGIPEED